MVRTAYAETKLLNYLSNVSKKQPCVVGLIIGQPLGGNFYILHLAQTPFLQSDNDKPLQDATEIKESAVAEHAKHTTRMLSGGLYVLGLFVTSDENVLDPLTPKFKGILTYLHKFLTKNPLIFGSWQGKSEKLVLHYNSTTKTCNANCFTFDSQTIVTNVAFEFVKNELQWLKLKSKYEMNETIIISDLDYNVPLKDILKNKTSNLKNVLSNAIYLFDNKCQDEDKTLETIKSTKKERGQIAPQSPEIQTTILLRTSATDPRHTTNVTTAVGFLKFRGLISSNLWLNPKTSIHDASSAIREDIIRSITSRLSMHFDSLTEGEQTFSDDTSCIHEPPRRIAITLPENYVTLSDYLFPGEGPSEAEESFEDILDITLTKGNFQFKEIEGQYDLSEYYSDTPSIENQDILDTLPADQNKYIYIIGGSIALLVVIISIIVHYIRQ